MAEIDKLMVFCGGVQTRWTMEAEAPLPASCKLLPNKVLRARAGDAWKAAERLRCLIHLWSHFLCLGMLRARLGPDAARQIRERFPELADLDTVLEAVASTVQFPAEMGAELAEFDREHGLRRERGNAEGPSKRIKLRTRDFERLRRAVGTLLEAEAACLHGLDLNVEQFRRPWQVLRREIQGFIGIDEDWASEPPRIEFGLALKGEGFLRGRASLLCGVEHLCQLLNNYPETALERAVRDDVPKPGRPSRGALSADEANVLVGEYLIKHPSAKSKVIA